MVKFNGSLWLGLVLFGLALLLVLETQQVGADKNHEDEFYKQMSEIIDDKETRDTLMKYFDKVPMTHKSRKHAQRCFLTNHIKALFRKNSHHSSSSSSTTTTTTTTSKSHTPTAPFGSAASSILKKVLEAIFAQGKHINKQHEACQSCPPCQAFTLEGCFCSKDECKDESACAPCPLPAYCRPAAGNETCPPKPICDVCSVSLAGNGGNSTFSGSQITKSTFSSSSTPAKVTFVRRSTTRKPGADNEDTSTEKPEDDGPPPSVFNLMKFLMMAEMNQGMSTNTTSTTTTSSSFNESSSSSSLISSEDGNVMRMTNSTIEVPTTTTTTTTSTSRRPSTKRQKSTTRKPRTSRKPKASVVLSPTTTAEPSSTTTKAPHKTSKRPSKRARQPSKLSGGMTMTGTIKLSGNNTVTTSRNSTISSTKDGHLMTNTTTSTTSTTGSFLFEKNIKVVVSNATIREHLLKMIEEIPDSTGGEEMKLAKKLLAHFGEKKVHLELTKKKGSNRAFTFMKAKANFKGILGHLMERFTRNKCECEPCKMSNEKNCANDCGKTPPERRVCPIRKPNYKCSPCPTDISCPAPKGCPTYPACKTCPKPKVNPDDDGPLEELDDMDTRDTLKEGELKKDIECKKGFTCSYQKTCGKADKNPLTPKDSQQGYMNGGEDEIYGEWPHFVSLRVQSGDITGLCGGVLISDRHVLTAAHCVHKPKPDGSKGEAIAKESFTVILGEHDKRKKDEFEESFNVSKICSSKKFYHDADHGSVHDFAVLTLDKNVTFNDNIQPVCLPYKALDLYKKPKCFVVGLGATTMREYGPTEFAQVVQKMRVERTSCKSWGVKHDDRSRHCFTKANAKGDTCGGDSGGPIVCLSKQNRWTLMGLVSYGSDLCDGSESHGWVGVYARIPAILKSIKSECGV